MANIKRSRTRNEAPGLTAPTRVIDPAAQKALAEAQAAIVELYSRKTRLESTTEVDPYDDAWVKRAIRKIEQDIIDLERRVAALERKFPIIRYVRVKADQPDYLECVFYSPATDTEGAAVNIAKPFALRRTPWDGATVTSLDGESYTYTYSSNFSRSNGTDQESLAPYYMVDELLAVARTPNVVEDLDGNIIAWEDLNLAGRDWAGGGGGGLKIYYGANEAAVRAISPTETFAFGYGTSDQMLLSWEGDEWRRLNRLKASG